MSLIFFNLFPLLATAKTNNYKLTVFRGFNGCQQGEKSEKKSETCVFKKYID